MGESNAVPIGFEAVLLLFAVVIAWDGLGTHGRSPRLGLPATMSNW